MSKPAAKKIGNGRPGAFTPPKARAKAAPIPRSLSSSITVPTVTAPSPGVMPHIDMALNGVYSPPVSASGMGPWYPMYPAISPLTPAVLPSTSGEAQLREVAVEKRPIEVIRPLEVVRPVDIYYGDYGGDVQVELWAALALTLTWAPTPHPAFTHTSSTPHPAFTHTSSTPHPAFTHTSPSLHPHLTQTSPRPHPDLTQTSPRRRF